MQACAHRCGMALQQAMRASCGGSTPASWPQHSSLWGVPRTPCHTEDVEQCTGRPRRCLPIQHALDPCGQKWANVSFRPGRMADCCG